ERAVDRRGVSRISIGRPNLIAIIGCSRKGIATTVFRIVPVLAPRRRSVTATAIDFAVAAGQESGHEEPFLAQSP
ncbi:hypothetical protein ABTN43_20050, partial [Acinetobacter baumannii]